MILAGNITPIDVITHIPILCEEHQIPYVWVPSKEQLGRSMHVDGMGWDGSSHDHMIHHTTPHHTTPLTDSLN